MNFPYHHRAEHLCLLRPFYEFHQTHNGIHEVSIHFRKHSTAKMGIIAFTIWWNFRRKLIDEAPVKVNGQREVRIFRRSVVHGRCHRYIHTCHKVIPGLHAIDMFPEGDRLPSLSQYNKYRLIYRGGGLGRGMPAVQADSTKRERKVSRLGHQPHELIFQDKFGFFQIGSFEHVYGSSSRLEVFHTAFFRINYAFCIARIEE